jgi:hypothetical protein
MAYTPELSDEASCTLRRIAWALHMPMTKALDILMNAIPMIIDPKKICAGCKDKTRCQGCIFSGENHRTCEHLINIIRKGEIDHVGNDHTREGIR